MEYRNEFGPLAQHIESSVDNILRQGPGLLLAVHVTPTGTSVGTVVMYDGVDANGRKMIDVRTAVGLSLTCELRYPLTFHQGLFLDVGTNVDSCVITWYPLENG